MMMIKALQRRDLEILRTLVRLRYLMTDEIAISFFANPAVARKRLRHLSGLGLIAQHRKGIPESLPGFAWRLTTRGVEFVAEAFPEEPIPEELGERLCERSLTDLDHRQALTRLYLNVLAALAGRVPENASPAQLDAVISCMRESANVFVWQPDGDVVLKFERASQQAQVIPDATICSKQRDTRIFIELDRSTHPLHRVREALEKYAYFFEHIYSREFADQRDPILAFVARTEARQANLHQVCSDILGELVTWAVLRDSQMPDWLVDKLFTHRPVPEPARISPPHHEFQALVQAAKDLYVWTHRYRRELNASGKSFPQEGDVVLKALHTQLRGFGGAQRVE